MLYMTIVTWEPAQRDAVLKRFAAGGAKMPDGVKTLGLWADAHGGRIFQLSDWSVPHDAKRIVESTMPWTDLCKIECLEVVEAAELMKLLPKR